MDAYEGIQMKKMKDEKEPLIEIEIDASDDSEKEEPSECELDMHYNHLMKAEAVKGNPHIMKYLKPYMEKKSAMHKKIMSIDDIRKAEKKIPND